MRWAPLKKDCPISTTPGLWIPGMFDRMEKQNYNSPLARTVQVLFVAIVAFILGLDTTKFSGSEWDLGKTSSELSAQARCVY